jgi:hypothetical protein
LILKTYLTKQAILTNSNKLYLFHYLYWL